MGTQRHGVYTWKKLKTSRVCIVIVTENEGELTIATVDEKGNKTPIVLNDGKTEVCNDTRFLMNYSLKNETKQKNTIFKYMHSILTYSTFTTGKETHFQQYDT